MSHPSLSAVDDAELRRKIAEAVAEVFGGEHRGLTATERSMRASIAALTRWSKEDPAENAARGQSGLKAKFLREIDEEFPGLTEQERNRRAEARYKAHMKRIRYAGLRKSSDGR